MFCKTPKQSYSYKISSRLIHILQFLQIKHDSCECLLSRHKNYHKNEVFGKKKGNIYLYGAEDVDFARLLKQETDVKTVKLGSYSLKQALNTMILFNMKHTRHMN